MRKSKKREVLQQAISEQQKPLTPEKREDLGKALLSPKSPFRKTIVVLDEEDLEWLDKTASILRRSRRKTNKSELIRLGVSLLKKKSFEELVELLRYLE